MLSRTIVFILVGFAAAALARPAQAERFGPQDWQPCLGQAVCEVAGLRLAAGSASGPATFAEQVDAERGGAPGLGVMADPGNGFNDPELQGPVGDRGGERIEVELVPPRAVISITLAHLFNPEEVEGDPPETAIIEGFAGGESLGTVTVVSERAGEIRLDGPAAGADRLPGGGGGVLIRAPFGAREVSRVVFTAAAVTSGDSADYSIAGIRTLTATPD